MFCYLDLIEGGGDQDERRRAADDEKEKEENVERESRRIASGRVRGGSRRGGWFNILRNHRF